MPEKLQNDKKPVNKTKLTILIVSAIFFVAAISSSIIMLSMNSSKNDKQKNFTAHEIADRVIKGMKYENLSEISAENIAKYYEIPDGTISDSAMYVSPKPDSFTELACFRLRSEDSEDLLMNSIHDYINERISSFENVNDKAYEAVQGSRVFVHYPYVLVSVSADNAAVDTVFESVFTPDNEDSFYENESSLSASEIIDRTSVVELSVDDTSNSADKD